jgi:guanyl-specific ribonuclease Sa
MTRKPLKRIAVSAILLLLQVLLASCLPAAAPPKPGGFQKESAQTAETQVERPPIPTAAEAIPEDSILTSKVDVSLYLHIYGRLPANFIKKEKARSLGWSGGDLRPYAEDTCIGGDRFGNLEGLLPEKRSRVYYECDIDALGRSSRSPRRIVYSNGGLIYYIHGRPL